MWDCLSIPCRVEACRHGNIVRRVNATATLFKHAWLWTGTYHILGILSNSFCGKTYFHPVKLPHNPLYMCLHYNLHNNDSIHSEVFHIKNWETFHPFAYAHQINTSRVYQTIATPSCTSSLILFTVPTHKVNLMKVHHKIYHSIVDFAWNCSTQYWFRPWLYKLPPILAAILPELGCSERRPYGQHLLSCHTW